MANFLTPFSADDLDRALGGAKGSVIDQALAAEGKSGQIAEVAKSIYQQESGSGRNTATSNAGAVGGMQVLPATFARMADADWDINDPVQNARAGVRYIDRLLQAAGGDARLAAAGYYGGEGAIEKARRGEAVSDPRNPGAPNTLQYADQVTGRLGAQPKPAPKKGYEPSKSPDDFYSGPRSAGGIEIRDKLPTAGFADYGKAFMASGLDAVGAIGTTIGQYIMAPVANAITGTNDFEGKNVLAGASKSLLDSMSEGGKRAMAEAQMPGDLLKPETWELPTTWQGLAMAGTSGLGSLLPAVASMFTPAGWVRIGAGAAIGGSTTAGSAIADVREGLRDRFSKLTHEQMLEASPAYAEAFRATGDEGKARQAVISSAENWAGLLAFGAGAVGGAFNNKFLEDLIEKKGVSELLGKTAESKAVRGAAGGVAAEGSQEAMEQTGQNVGENVGLGRPALEDATRDTFGQAVGGALVGGALGGAGGAMSRHTPKAIEPPPVVVPPELAPVAAKAAEGNSPLSSAAMAGATSQINAANNDPLKARVDALVQEVRSSGLLQSMREIGIPGLTSKELLDAIAQAQNPTNDPRVREQAIASIEMAMGWAQDGLMPGRRSPIDTQPGTDIAAAPAPAQPGTDLVKQQGGPVAPAGMPQAFDPNTVEGQATRVDNMIGGPKALPAPIDQAGPVQRSVPSSDTQLGYDPAVAPPASNPNPPAASATGQQGGEQQAAQPKPTEPPRIGNETVSQPKVATPAGEGSAFMRKRKAALRQLADNGFDRVEQRDGKWAMVNSKTGQKFLLDGIGEVALARKAVADSVHARAADTNTAPSEAQAKAGNYKKARVEFDGLKIAIENPIGSTRSGTSPDGKKWQTTMSAAYGYVERTEGADGDQHDVYIAPEPRAGAPVFVVDQYNDDGTFDEHKSILGATSQAQAERIYDAHFSDGSGPRRRKAVTEMSMDQFKDWLKSSDAVKPAAARTPDDIATQVEPENTKLTVRDDGKDVTIDLVGDAQLPDESPARGPKASQITKRQAAMIKAVAQVFGKQVAFFDEGNAKLGDGFVRPGDDTIYINQQSGISPLAVFGHELLHMVRRENPKAYDAMALAISTRVRHSDGFRADYYGIDAARAKAGQVLNDRELEELVADLNGNLMTDPKFWQEVFDQVAKSTPAAESKSIIAKLVEQVTRLVSQLAQSIKQPGFAANSFVTDLDSIRAAVRDGLADYVNDAGLTKAGMQAEVLRAGQARKSASRDVTQTPEFKAWFGDSKVVDKRGRPLVVYHGTGYEFSAFDPGMVGSTMEVDDVGFFFTNDRDLADRYAEEAVRVAKHKKQPAAEKTLATYVSLKNPWIIYVDTDKKSAIAHFEGGEGQFNRGSGYILQYAQDSGYDGVIIQDRRGLEGHDALIVAFRPEQIKSAIGNNGQFDPANPDITKSTSRQPEVGIHYSNQPRANLDGSYNGRGHKGIEAERLAKSTDPRIKKRVYFYTDEGSGIHPEAGLGGFAHEIKLPKLYDAVANPDRLWNSGDLSATESRILDAGYDGYWIKNHPTKQGIGVILGKASQGIDAKQIPNPATAAPVYQAAPEAVKKGLMSKELDAVDVSRIPGAKLRMGMLTVPPESLAAANAEMERIGSSVRFSKARLATPEEQIEEVRKKYEGTEQWMKAPNGKATKLNERQWLHVRTPSFLKWFGPWEDFASMEGGVWNDGDGKVSKVVDAETGEPLVVYHGSDKAGFAEFEQPGGQKRGDLGIFLTDDLSMAQTYVHRGRGRMVTEGQVNDEDTQPGVYALFANIRNPNEAHFEGANWDGNLEGAHIVLDENGDQHYAEDGRQYFTPGEAEDIANEIGGTSELAPDLGMTTDSVVKEAWKYDNDGAIIRQARDDGGGNSSYAGEPADAFVALSPDQVKSADFNSGEYSVDTNDIRFSKGRLERVHDMEMSTRAPSAKPTKDFKPEDSKANLLISNFEAGLGQEKWLGAVTDLVEQYPNYRSAPSAKTPEQKLERMVRQMTDNLLWLHDQVPSDIRNRSKLWYDGARAIVDRWMKRYDLTDAQASGILAVLSPQKDWFMNVSLANRVIDIMSDRQAFRWSKQMDETAARIFGKAQYNEDIEAIRGQALQDLDDDYLRAMWVRVFDEAHNSRSFMIVSPEGDFVAEARTKDGTAGKVAWGGNSTIAKAVRIFGDGSFDAISDALGRKHKVRNFYNNILVPNSPNGHVTIDTHAVAAALLRALSGFSTEVMQNFGGPKSAHAGLEGTYALYEEAYHRAAQARGLLPREMQSITWEAVRGLFVPGFKSQQKNVDAVDAVWNQYRKGRLSYENARQQTLELAGGIEPPSWAGRDPGAYVEDEPAVDDGDLPADGVSAGGAAADGGDSVQRAAAASGRSADVRRSAQRGGGRDSGRELAPLPGAPNVRGASGPDPRLVEVAERYAADNGISLRRQAEYVQVDPARAKRIAEAYEAMPHAPRDPKVREAYENLIKQTVAQYRALEAAGYRFFLHDETNDPYGGNPWNAMRDLRATQSMGVFATEAGFGTNVDFDAEDNPLLADTGIKWPWGSLDGKPKRVLANDLFRAVHDAFGHGLEGAGFRAQGEENAWQAHVRMFTGSAVGAITTETRGQNSWLNYGPNGEKNQTASVEDTVFADQKTGLLPSWVWKEGIAPDEQPFSAEPPADLVRIFEGLDGRGLAKQRAQEAAAEHQFADTIADVNKNFLDLLQEFEDSGALRINCD